jgi:formylglycine-generating enzyme required for sulfatase activity
MSEPSNAKKLQVFLCHSSGDKAPVRELYHRLEKDNFTAWLDEEDLLPGQRWDLEIPKAIRKCDVILVCLSQAAVDKAGYVQKEIRFALDIAEEQPEGSIYIIPVRLEECIVPERLRPYHWVNLFEERGYTRLTKALNAKVLELGKTNAPTPPTNSTQANKPAPNPPPQPDPKINISDNSNRGKGDQFNVGNIQGGLNQGNVYNVNNYYGNMPPGSLDFSPPPHPSPLTGEGVESGSLGISPSPPPVTSSPVKGEGAEPAVQSPTKPEPTEQEKLLRELENLSTSHERRRDIGVRLAEIGDNRPGVGVRADGLPDIAWLPVTPGGDITLKIDDKVQTFQVAPFWIAKYPVTFAQYQIFVEAKDGFANPQWWKDMPKEYQRQKLDAQFFKGETNPRDKVSWYQSVAFARWLNHKLQGQSATLPDNQTILTIGQNAEVRLPTEWEWQWAAQGGTEKREYPWGKWREGYAITREARLQQTIAVGLYPQGAAICGAMDMSGQVWEWCANKYSNPKDTIIDNSTRVLRGGSFDFDSDVAACAFRSDYNPSYSFSGWGFRVVVAPLISASDL